MLKASGSHSPMSEKTQTQPTSTLFSTVSKAVHSVSANVGSVSTNLVHRLSYESNLGRRYVLDWIQVRNLNQLYSSFLQYANNRIELVISQITRGLDVNVQWIVGIKREIVHTLRRVLSIVGSYAVAYLPGHAKSSIRNLFLSLPTRWVGFVGG